MKEEKSWDFSLWIPPAIPTTTTSPAAKQASDYLTTKHIVLCCGNVFRLQILACTISPQNCKIVKNFNTLNYRFVFWIHFHRQGWYVLWLQLAKTPLIILYIDLCFGYISTDRDDMSCGYNWPRLYYVFTIVHCLRGIVFMMAGETIQSPFI
jgi:hypothetical protein